MKTSTLVFAEVIAALLDESKPFDQRYLKHFSDLEIDELKQLAEVWSQVALHRRRTMMEDIQDIGEENYVLDFTSLCELAIKDEDPIVRVRAVKILGEYENPQLLPEFLRLAQEDNEIEVRAACISALGTFVYLGEVDQLPSGKLPVVEDYLLGIFKSDEVPLLRQKALESLGYSSRREVLSLIESAYVSGNQEWLLSSLTAMGHSCNSAFEGKVLAKLDDFASEVRAKAAAAAGGLTSRRSVPRLLELLEDENDEVRTSSIWALSEIGGPGVREALEEMLEETEDDGEVDLIVLALDNLSLLDESAFFKLMDLPTDELEDDYLYNGEDDK